MKFPTLLLPAAILLINGCTAVHPIDISSIPSGASIELNGEFIGTTPFTFEYESSLAQQIWPEHVQFRARMPLTGYTAEQKSFDRHSKLQRRIQFILYDQSDSEQLENTPDIGTTVIPDSRPTNRSTPGEPENEKEWNEYQSLFDEKSESEN